MEQTGIQLGASGLPIGANNHAGVVPDYGLKTPEALERVPLSMSIRAGASGMKQLAELILTHEEWLMHRVLGYARERDFAKYTSTLAEAWRIAIAGLSQVLLSALEAHAEPPELGPDADFASDPIAAFGIIEAQRHRSRGVSFGMFLGLMKYYRQSYRDLVTQAGLEREREAYYLLFIDRVFDRVELGFGTEWLAQSHDELVDELQETNRRITNEKNKYLTIFESLASPCVMLNSRNEIENMNHAAIRLVFTDSVPGSHYYGGGSGPELLHGLDQELAEFAETDHQETVFEKELKTGDEDLVFQVRFKRMLDVSGKFSGTVVVLTDITRRTHAERRLEENLKFLETLLDSIPNPVFFKDLNGNYLGSNKAFSDFLGLPKDQVVGRSVYDIAPKDLADCYHSKDLELFAKGGTQIYESSVRQADDLTRNVVFYKSVFHDSNGLVAGLIGVIVDITEMKQTEEEREILRKQLFQSQKMEAIATLTEGIAHDFNNMLTIILGFGELLLSEHQEGEQAYRDLLKINETARSGADLVSRLLAFSRRAEMKPRPLDLSSQVTLIKTFLERTTTKTVRFDTRPAPDLPMIDADPAQIDQILLNLVLNSTEAMPSGGTITITTGLELFDTGNSGNDSEKRSGTYVMLTVADTGCGMGPQIMDRIFDPFFTTKHRDTKKGTGLSLSVVRGIVEQHGGFIRCQSQPGIGTTFRVYFPAKKEGPMPVSETIDLRLAPPKGTVLLVDDEALVRDLGKRILSRAGFQVLTADNGIEALEIYRKNRSDIEVVILDMIMPEMGGEECMQRLLEINPEVKVVVTTGRSELLQERFPVSPAGFVRKPFRIDELLGQVLHARATA